MRNRRTSPFGVRPDQLYRWHKNRWYVTGVNVFFTSDGHVAGTVFLRKWRTKEFKSYDLVKFAGRARRLYGLDAWRKRR
jgi:hypothetical protein